jgi:hypothetical protein
MTGFSPSPLAGADGTIMLLENPEKVLEKLATSDRITIVIERQPDGKMRVTSTSWDGERVLMRDQVLEVRNATGDSRLHIARKVKRHDDWDPPIAPYDPYGPGVTGNAFESLASEFAHHR